MARHRQNPAATADAPSDPRRRAFITLSVPALGAAGLATSLVRPAPAATAEAPQPDDDGGSLTPHREAYYRRARF
jgi:hypothetical protein